jgi:hypothetical protein
MVQLDDDPVSVGKIEKWAKDPELKVHRIIALALRFLPLPREEFEREIEKRAGRQAR